MKVLAWDSSGSSESAAVLVDGKVCGQHFSARVPSHTQSLLGTLQDVLQQAGLGLKNIDLLAVTVGPGSFTGLRIGLATAKAFALAAALPVAPVSTLLALAQPHLETYSEVGVAIDARLQQVFSARYRRKPGVGWELLVSEACRSIADWTAQAGLMGGQGAVVGSGFQAHPALAQAFSLMPWLGGDEVDAVTVARIGAILHQQSASLAGRAIEARYLRLSEAENRLRAQSASSNLGSS